ncbi:SPOR domain-containing protein [Prevotella sp. HUN102]|uniref:SPOR domain-containing protein n=1 Tax=Prevotella sp. HUN102 TaxID=1392486 RepID=UPI0004914F95|nr:SPOR domain-containing protein [Prevotella sp. HUN102]
MKKFLALLVIAFFSAIAVNAQGTVTVTQSADVDAVVNGNRKAKTKAEKKAERKAAKQAAKENKENARRQQMQQTMAASQTASKPAAKPELKVPVVQMPPQPKIEVAKPSDSNTQTGAITQRTKWVRKRVRRQVASESDGTGETRTVTKRVVRGAKKARGFRVLAYSGGNTRAARQEAEKIGQKVKMICPEEPIYVHFYSPRWMCQVGNFTSYEKARAVMKKLKKEGYSHANIIRTMVTIKTTAYLDGTPAMEETY